MATKEAAIRVNLNGGAFLSGLRGLVGESRKVGRSIGKALSEPMSKGFENAKRSFGGMASSLKNGMMNVATLGGAVSMGAFTKEALNMEEAAGRVAMKLRRMGVEGANTFTALDVAKKAGEQFKLTTEDMLLAYEALLEDSGDPVFSQAALESVALMKNSMRTTTEEAVGLVGAFGDAGMSAEAIRSEMLPAIMDLGLQGGAQLNELIANAGALNKTMIATGLAGKKGFGMLVGMLNATDGAGEATARMAALSKILLKLSDAPSLKKLGTKLGIPGLSKSTDQVKNLQAILSKKGGFQQLRNLFGKGPTAAVFQKMMVPYLSALEKATAEGQSSDRAIHTAAAALGKSLEEATEVTATEADVRAEASKRVDEKSKQFELAIGRMKDAFLNEKFLSAIEKLATDVLPKVTEAFSKVVEFAADNPMLAAAALPAANVGMSFAAGAIGSGLKAGWSMLSGKLTGAAAAAAASKAAAASAETAAQAAARAAGGFGGMLTNSAGSAVGGAAASAASTGATSAAGGAVAAGGIAAGAITAAAVAGIAGIAATSALLVGTMVADSKLDTLDEARKASNESSRADTPAKRQAALRELHKQRIRVKNMSSGGMFDSLTESFGGRTVKQNQEQALSELNDAIAQLTASTKQAAAQQDVLSKSSGTAATNVGKLGGTAKNMSTPSTTRGPLQSEQPDAGASGGR